MRLSAWLTLPLLWMMGAAYGQLAGSDETSGVNRLQALYEAGDFPGALTMGRDLLDSPLSTAERVGVLNYLGAICYELARYDEAVGYLRRTLAELKDDISAESASVLNDLGECLRAAGDFDAARHTLDDALDRVRQVAPDTELHARILNNVAGLYRDQGVFARTEALLREALRITESLAESTGDRRATAHLNLAELLRFQSRYAEARPHYEKALAVARAAYPERHPYLVFFLNQFAVLLSEQGSPDAADSLRSEALQILQAQDSAYPILHAMLLTDRATDLLARGEATAAIEAYEQALALRRDTYAPGHWELGANLAQLARAQLEAGSIEPDRIVERATQALAILDRTPVSPENRADALAVRALARLRMGGLDGARADLDQAIEIVEQLRVSHGGGDESRARLLTRYFSYYDEAIDLALSGREFDRAIDYVERFRARALQEQLLLDENRLLESVEDSVRTRLHQQVAQAEATLVTLQDERAALAYDTSLPADTRSSKLAQLQDQLESAVRAFTAAQEQIRLRSPAWQALVRHRAAVSLDRIQAEMREGERMLVYWVGPAHGWLLEIPAAPTAPRAQPLVVDASAADALGVEPGDLTLARLAAVLATSRDAQGAGSLFELRRGINEVTDLPETGTKPAPPLDRVADRLHALWTVLLPTDTWERVRRATEVTILPSGPLHALPFEALVVAPPQGATVRYWLDDGPPLRYADSATTLLQMTEVGHQRRDYPEVDVLSVSNPRFAAAADESTAALSSAWSQLVPLPGTEEESRRLAEALGPRRVQRLTGGQATETAVRAACEDKRYLHLATHGVVDDSTSEVLAGLLLARENAAGPSDGRWQLYEIDGLHLRAQLAVLSACRTAAGKRLESEGVFALSRGFHVAGALRVVASLWSVSDASTAVLIGELFSNLAQAERRDGEIGCAQALRDAKRVVRSNPQWSQPFYWAPFLLSGIR